MSSLTDFCNTNLYNTDKFYSGHLRHSYIENFYSKIFESKKESAKNILEIGIYEGGSIQLWRDYFTNSTIFGIDCAIQPTAPIGDRTYLIYGDAYSDSIVNSFTDNYFDIIIDDGPHTVESQCLFFEKYFSKLKSGGYLICEDINGMDSLLKITNHIPNEYKSKIEIIDLRRIDNRFDSLILFVEK